MSPIHDTTVSESEVESREIRMRDGINESEGIHRKNNETLLCKRATQNVSLENKYLYFSI